jgi:Glycosyltransferase family 87
VSGTRPPPRPADPGPSSHASLSRALELAALGAGLTLTTTFIAGVRDPMHALGTYQALYAVAFTFFGLAVWQVRRFAGLPHAGAIVMAVAIAARMPLLFTGPSLSDDLYRYVWEGRVIVHGGNPYAQSPADPALAPLRDRTIHPRVNHPELATIYPPLAEAEFALVARISATVRAFKFWVVLHDLALIAVLMRLLKRQGSGAIAAIAYAWNPLVIVEFAGSGHMDPMAMLWLAVAWLACDRRPVLSALALAAGVLIKLAPLVALPFFLRRWPWRARVTAGLTLAVGLGWFWMLTRGASSGLQAYWSRWRNNELVFYVLEHGLGGFDAARAAALAIVAVAVVLALIRHREVIPASRLSMRVATVVSPVVHPWYLAWVMMFEPFRPSAPWLLLSLTAVLNYGVFAAPAEGRSYHLPVAWRVVEYGLPLILAFVLVLVHRVRFAGTASGGPDAG